MSAAWRQRALPIAGWLVASMLLACAGPSRAADTHWTIAGQQGVVRFVIVPAEQAADRSAYDRELSLLCEPERTCFLNFYTNSTGTPATVPLPDAIANEATATFRRSAKQGAERFMWSCRMKQASEDCF